MTSIRIQKLWSTTEKPIYPFAISIGWGVVKWKMETVDGQTWRYVLGSNSTKFHISIVLVKLRRAALLHNFLVARWERQPNYYVLPLLHS